MRAIRTLGFITGAFLLAAGHSRAGDWLTFGHDPQRTGWAADEKILNPKNVSSMSLAWKVKLDNPSFSLSALTAPVAISRVETASGPRGVVYVGGWNGTVYALDAATGEIIWTRLLSTMATPRIGGMQGTFHCPGGITATPVIDQAASIVYVIAPDGALYGLDLGRGSIRFGPVPFVAPFSKNWSLNLSGGAVYTSVSLGCGNGSPGVYSANVRERSKPILRESLLSKVHTAGIWGRGGPIIGQNGKIYGGTSDGDSDPANGDYSNSVVALSQSDLSVADYFLPKNWRYLKAKDLDMASASPVWFSWKHRNLLAHASKEGILRLLDADNLGGEDHQTALFTMRIGNDKQACCEGIGVWGSLSASTDADGQVWIYVPLGGPPSADAPKFPITNGPNPHGSVLAFKVVSDTGSSNPRLDPVWISGDFGLPDPIVVANGVVFSLSNGENADQRGDESKRFLNTHPAELKALDARTGKELYSSGASMESWDHFSGLALSEGRVYAVDHNSNVYCFGLPGMMKLTKAPIGAKVRADEADLSASWVNRVQHQEEYKIRWFHRVYLALGIMFLAAVAGCSMAVIGQRL